ncbi:hypothetical protein DFQ28_008072, partial [Apophysomyces sp. BC1034]
MCLKRTSAVDYWQAHTLHENIVDKFYDYELEKSTQKSYPAESSKSAGKRTMMETRSAKRKRITVIEDGGILTRYLGKSLGTIIKTEALNMVCDQASWIFQM